MNVGIIAPIPSDGTSLYRAHGPLAYLSRLYGIKLIVSEEWDWTNVLQCNVLFLQRPFTDQHLVVARTAKALNVPLWVDYDDLYDAFPPWTQVQQTIYMCRASIENMRKCIELANVVTVSTEFLKCLSSRAEVIPNALPTYFWPLSEGPRQKIISWRGSGGHNGDLGPVLPIMRDISDSHRDWKWHFFGMPSYECTEFGEVHPYIDAFSYMQQFAAYAPAIHVVPLSDCRFNRAKSNNAWLEATAAGAVVVAPNWAEWIRPGIINYSDGEGFRSAVLHAMSLSDDDRESLVNMSRDYIEQNLTLHKVNERRAAILARFK